MNLVKNVTNRHHLMAALAAAISVEELRGVGCRVSPRRSRLRNLHPQVSLFGRALPGPGALQEGLTSNI